MAESTLSISRSDLDRRIGMRLGYRSTLRSYNPEQKDTIDLIRQDALSRFYFPTVPGESSYHEWSFLSIEHTLNLTASVTTYDLPDTFTGDLESLQITSATGKPAIEVVTQKVLNQAKAEGASAASPRYAAVQVKGHTTSASAGQRWEIEFYPAPDTAYTASYTTAVLPDDLTSTVDYYPLGSAAHHQILVEAALAVAVEYLQPDLPPEQNTHQQRFESLLSAAVERDKRFQKPDTTQAITAPTAGTFDWFRQQIAGHRFNKWNLHQLSHGEKATVDRLLTSGLNRLYFPMVPGENRFHEWSFLRIEDSISLTSGVATYTLADKFGGKINSLQITSAAGKSRIAIVGREEMRQSSGSEAASNGVPRYASLQVDTHTTTSTDEQRWELEFYPVPDTSYTAKYSSTVLPGEIDTTHSHYPLGTEIHQQALLESVLAVTATDKNPGADQNPHQQRFESLLATAIAQDVDFKKADSLQAINAPSTGTFDWFRREIAGAAFDKWNLFQLSHNEEATVERLLTSGLNQLYFPTNPSSGESHEWSFLRIEKTITTSSGTSTYALPASFGGRIRDLQITSAAGKPLIQVVSQEKLTQSRGAEAASNATPAYAAVQTTGHTTSASNEQRWEIEFYPTPDNTYTIAYTSSILPGEVDAAHSYYPLGTEVHQQALREAVLSQAYAFRNAQAPVEENPHQQRFEKLLSGAINHDIQLKEEASLQAITDPTAGTFDWFRREIAGKMFDKWNLFQLTHSEEATVERLLVSGLNRFYYPLVPGENRFHEWSFLRIEKSFSTVASTATYTLPDSFGGKLKFLQITSASGNTPIEIVSQEKLTQSRGSEAAASGVPVYGSLQVDTHTTSASDEQRWELELYPTPDDSYTIAYSAAVLSGEVDSVHSYYPLGTEVHQQALLQAILSVVAENRNPDAETNPHQQRFEALLAGAIDQDIEFQKTESLQAITAPTVGTFDWYRREIAGIAFDKWNLFQLTHGEKATVETLLTSGLNRLYFPTNPANQEFHEWSFLTIESTFATIGGTSIYSLPASFGGKIRQLQITSASGKRMIEVVSQNKLTQSRGSEAASNAVPLYAAVQTTGHTTGDATEQRWQIELYPTPDDAYTIAYTASVLPGEIDTTHTYYPLGTEVHQQALLESVRSCAFAFRNPKEENPHQQQFERLLSGAIGYDVTLKEDASLQAVTAPTAGTFDWFRREIAGRRFNKWNLHQLTHSEKATVERLLVYGLNRFYFPMVPGENRFHEWSFLRIQKSFTTSAGTSTYTLPDSFGGKLEFLQITSASGKKRIEMITHGEMAQSRGSEAASNAVPLYGALQVDTHVTTSSDEQRWELELYPTPDDSYTIAYSAAILPGEVDAVHSYYPLGTEVHQQALMASLLVVIEDDKNPDVAANPHEPRFDKLMAAAIAQDVEFKQASATQAVNAPATGTFDWFRREIAGKMFDKWNLFQLSHSESATVEKIMISALNRFYFPTVPGQNSFHEWSFLRLQSTLTTSSGTSTYDLPATFGGKLIDLQITSAAGKPKIEVVKQSEITQSRGAEAASDATPAYAAVQVSSVTTDSANEQRCSIEFYPTPDDTYTIAYTSAVLPGEVTSVLDNYPLGNQIHQQLLLESSLAVAFEYRHPELPDDQNSHQRRFESLLVGAVDQDAKLKEAGELEAITAPATGSFDWYRREIADKRFKKRNLHQLTHREKATVEQLLTSGLNRLYFPLVPGQDRFHEWSFLKIEQTMSVVSGTSTYTLPDSFGGKLKTLQIISASGNSEIEVVTQSKLTQSRGSEAAASATPLYAAIQPASVTTTSTDEQRWEIEFYPTPDDTYTIAYSVAILPGEIDTTHSHYPLGTEIHQQALLESVLVAACEDLNPEQAARHDERFQRLLLAAIDQDMKAKKAGDIQAVTAPADGTFDYYRREIAGRAFDKWNINQLTHGEKATVQRLLTSALDRFYRPAMAGEGLYRWSFMVVDYTLTTVSGQSDYTLSADHGGVIGPLFLTSSSSLQGEVTKTSVENIQSYRAENVSFTTQPSLFAERPTTSDGTGEHVWELLLWPTPSAVYTLSGTRLLDPAQITSAAPYPLGGRAHRDTILASCRAVAELEKSGKAGAYEADFQKRLSASLQADMQTHQSQILGYNGDGIGRRGLADRRPDGRYENFSLLTYPSGS